MHCVCICRESIDCMNGCCYVFNCYIVLDREMKIVKRGRLRFLIVLFSFSFSPFSSLLTRSFDLSIFVLLFSFSFFLSSSLPQPPSTTLLVYGLVTITQPKKERLL